MSLGGRYTNDQRHAHVFRADLILGGSPELGGSAAFGVGSPSRRRRPPTSTAGAPTRRSRRARRSSSSRRPTTTSTLSYSKGFKGGGFDPRGLSTAGADRRRLQDDLRFHDCSSRRRSTATRSGWKAALFDRRLQFATAVFDAEYKDVQVPGSAAAWSAASRPSAASPPMPARRASAASSSRPTARAGARISPTPGDRLNFAGTLGYLDAKYMQFITNIAGDPSRPVDVAELPQDPEHAEMDAQRLARLRHAARRRPSRSQHDAVVPQHEPTVRAADADARPAGFSPVGCEHRLALARQPLRVRAPRQEPDQQEVHRRLDTISSLRTRTRAISS